MLIQRRHLLIGAAVAGLAPRLAFADPVRVPFKYTDGKIRVPVRIGGVDVDAVLNSGGAFHAMDEKLARDLRIRVRDRFNLNTVTGSSAARISDPVDVTVAGQSLPQTQFAVLNLSKFSASVGQPVDLIVGAPLFQRFVVDIDFEGLTLALATPAAFGLPESGVMEKLSMTGGFMSSIVYLPGGKLTASVDTGSDAALTLSPKAAARLGVLTKGPVSTALIAGVAGTSIGQITSTPSLGFAAHAFEDVPIQVAAGEFGSEGNVGLGLLSRFHAAFDLSEEWLVLSDPRDGPFKRDLTGLKADVQASGLRITHVSRAGPAEKAGFKVGEVVTAIDGEPAAAANVRLADAPAGRTVAFTLRGGRMRSLTLARYY